ncbi:MAG: glycoside hydrolase family 2 TIM barrel-domain containing protein [Candidatus Hydrogenedentota bacterium]
MKNAGRSLQFILVAVFIAEITSACGQASAPGETPVAPLTPITGKHEIEMRGKRLYLDGKPFYVRGVGYEPGCRPGRLPWKREFEPELLRWDFEQIRKAGFNTLRTWSPMTDSELALAADHGLWVVQGIWTDWNRFWTDSAYHHAGIENVRNEVARSSKHPNILFYLVMNEPSSELLVKLDPDLVRKGFIELKDAVHSANSAALASFSNCPLTDFLDGDLFDLLCSNNYPYGPEPLHYALGYDGYTDWIVRRADGRPYFTTEFGLSVSPEGPGQWGYGGNSPEEQADGVSTMYRTIASSGAAGAFPFMWVDGWWKSPTAGPGNESRHDSHAEEWFGFIDVSPENLRGTARPVVAALAEANRLLVLSPAPGDVVHERIAARAVSTSGQPEARVGSGEWIKLEPAGHEEWAGELPAPASGPAAVEFRAGSAIRSVPVTAGPQPGPPGRLTLAVDSPVLVEGGIIRVAGRLEDFTGATAANRTVYLCLRDYRSGGDRMREIVTDSAGQFQLTLGTMGAHGIMGIAAGAEITLGGLKRRIGDQVFIRIHPNPLPEKLLTGRQRIAIAAFELASAKIAQEKFQENYTGDATIEADVARGSLLLKYQPKGGGSWIYIARMLDKVVDLSTASFLSFELSSNASGTPVKVMLKDADGERWFQGAAESVKGKSRQVVWDLHSDMMRDPYDGAKSGNGRFDPDRIAGVSIVMTGPTAADVRLSRMSSWK